MGLAAQFDRRVEDDDIDENGHMNVTSYFRWGIWAPWKRLEGLGMGQRYLDERRLSFFTVEQRLGYHSEMRHGQHYTTRAALVERSDKALHLASFVIDEERATIACFLELMYVHVSLESRRAVAIPDDLASAIDEAIATDAWVRPLATGLTLRRS